MLSCKELFDIFQKVGGKLECKYDTKKCTFLPQNVTCDITNSDKDNLDSLVWNYAPTSYGVFTRISLLESIKPVEILHNYQFENDIGFVIEFSKYKKIN